VKFTWCSLWLRKKAYHDGTQSNEQEPKFSMTFPDYTLYFGNVKILSNKNPFMLHVRYKGARKNKKRALNDMSESIKCCFKTALMGPRSKNPNISL
jgi:hypothetical protein